MYYNNIEDYTIKGEPHSIMRFYTNWDNFSVIIFKKEGSGWSEVYSFNATKQNYTTKLEAWYEKYI